MKPECQRLIMRRRLSVAELETWTPLHSRSGSCVQESAWGLGDWRSRSEPWAASLKLREWSLSLRGAYHLDCCLAPSCPQGVVLGSIFSAAMGKICGYEELARSCIPCHWVWQALGASSEDSYGVDMKGRIATVCIVRLPATLDT